jgi:putative NADH-flavin reductase
MIVAMIGASGNAGSRILAELSRRGHEIRALVRHPDRVPALKGVTAHQVDANDGQALSALLRGADAVISSVKFKDTDARGLIESVRQAGVKRYLELWWSVRGIGACRLSRLGYCGRFILPGSAS